MGATVFFKHKYLAMPTVTTSDALIKAAEDMTHAVLVVFPTSGPTQEAIEQLMRIFKKKARTEVDSARNTISKGAQGSGACIRGC